MKKYEKLSPEEAHVILEKGTEPPFTGEYNNLFSEGVFVCRQCSAPLYTSATKFLSHCGWPSFDEEIPGMVYREPDPDGRRTEIICANCKGHLGHVFTGEHYTEKDTRHCVNSLSIRFVKAEQVAQKYQQAVFASGCFWGTEYWFSKLEGVIATTVGYAGGHTENPSYRQVCTGSTGHAESIRVFYDPNMVSYTALVKLFFETHDPTQVNGQGPDIGSQYRSVIFTLNDEQKAIAEKYRDILAKKGLTIATQIEPLQTFYPEKDRHHHQYYEQINGTPYCHIYQKRF